MWQNEKFTLSEKIFREIIYLVISVVVSQTITFTKVAKKCDSKFPQFTNATFFREIEERVLL